MKISKEFHEGYQEGYKDAKEEFKCKIDKIMQELYYSNDAVNMGGEYQGLWVRWRAIEKAFRGE